MQAKELDNSRAVPPASDLRLAAERLERVALWLREQAERIDPSNGPPLKPDGDNDG